MTDQRTSLGRTCVPALAAGVLLLASLVSAAAQSASAAVVCVGSERRILESAGPVRRVITEDVAVVYRVGVQTDDREGMERTLIAELGDHEEASCAWSNPGDGHLAIIRYTGAIRRDLTLDPDDPRFQAFAVGYGTSAEAAEENATRADARFSTYADDSGYEVLVEEGWSVDVAKLPAGTEFSDCDACPRMVIVPAGTFTMGSPASEEGRWDWEGPQHSVTIPAPFAVGMYEVTFAEWEACVRAGGCGGYMPNDRGWGRGRRPVMNVSWDDAQTYVSWLSQQTGAPYRLLSEAEWEYVARAGTSTARYWGESDSRQCRYENGADAGCADCVACNDGYRYTAPVGSFAPNAFGLYDVLGNVREWTQDCGNDSYVGAPADGSAWQAGDCSKRIRRASSWADRASSLRSASRFSGSSDTRYPYNGFRVARTLN